MEWIAEFFDYIVQYLIQIPDMFQDFMVKAGAWFVIWYTKAKLAFVTYSWQVAKSVLVSLNISGTLNAAWGSINPEIMAYISAFRLPECLNIILNAWVTRYVLSVFK